MLNRNRNRAKIVATMGPSTRSHETLDGMILAGLDIARLNCSFLYEPGDMRWWFEHLREGETRTGQMVGILVDLQGPKIRLSRGIPNRELNVGDVITFASAKSVGSNDWVGVEYEDFAHFVTKDSVLAIGDGKLRLAVQSIGEVEVVAVVIAPGTLAEGKGINVTNADPNRPALTEQDLGHLAEAAELGADAIAVSFVRSARDILRVREEGRRLGWNGRIIAKIETLEGYDHIDEILAVADGVMVARGDLGIEAPITAIPGMQHIIIKRAIRAGKFVITATEMLESMVHSPRPTRAETTDPYNAIYDGSSAVMLSAETATGGYPVDVVRTMAELVREAEKKNRRRWTKKIRSRACADSEDVPTAAVIHAIELAETVRAVAVIVLTARGESGRIASMAFYRGPVIAIADAGDEQATDRIARGMLFYRGVYPTKMVYPTPMPPGTSADWPLEKALETARQFAGLRGGARVVVVAGRQPGVPGRENLTAVREIPRRRSAPQGSSSAGRPH